MEQMSILDYIKEWKSDFLNLLDKIERRIDKLEEEIDKLKDTFRKQSAKILIISGAGVIIITVITALVNVKKLIGG